MSPCCGPLASQSWSSLRLSYSFCLVGSGLAAQVGFGASPPDDRHYLNMRAWMWGRVKDWLKFGSIAKDEALETDLTGPGYHHDKADRLVLESKDDMERRGLASPDDADALALTFAAVVTPPPPPPPPPEPGNEYSWMG